VLLVFSLAVATLGLAACGSSESTSSAAGGSTSAKSSSDSGDKKLVVDLTPGPVTDAFVAAYVKPFEKETGIDVQMLPEGADPFGQTQAQIQSGNVQWDMVGCGESGGITYPQYWENVDRSIVTFPSSGLVSPDMIGPKYMTVWVTTYPMLAYTTKAGSTTPQNWADFFNTAQFPGKRVVPNAGLYSAYTVPAAALLADGVPIDKLFPLDLDRAYKKLAQLKPNVKTFYTDFTQSQDLLKNGDASQGMMLGSSAQELAAADPDVKTTFNQGFATNAAFCVLKGAHHAANAFRLMQYIYTHPAAQAQITKQSYYSPPTKAGVAAATKAGLDFELKHVSELVPDTPAREAYVVQNQKELLSRWTDFVR
jgi:spermidine/putrescine-binding protein